MGKFNVIQFALYQALVLAFLGLVCGLLYPFFGHLFCGLLSTFFGHLICEGISLELPSAEGISGFYPTLIFVLKWLWALILFLLKWLWSVIWIPWTFAFFGFVAGIVEGILLKPIVGLFGSS